MKLNLANLLLFLGLGLSQVTSLPGQTATSGVPTLPTAGGPAGGTTSGPTAPPAIGPAVPLTGQIDTSVSTTTATAPLPGLPPAPARPSQNADGSPMTADVVIGKDRDAPPVKTFMKGVITEYVPGISLSLKLDSQPVAMRLVVSKITTMVDADGNPAEAAMLVKGATVNVECTGQGSSLVLNKVTVGKSAKSAVAAPAATGGATIIVNPTPAVEKVSTSTTTTTVNPGAPAIAAPMPVEDPNLASGVVTEMLPGSVLMVRGADGAEPMRYVYDKKTVIVDENGNVVDMAAIKRDVPVRIETAREGNATVVRRVIVQKKTQSVTPATGVPASAPPASGVTPIVVPPAGTGAGASATSKPPMPATTATGNGAIPNASPGTGSTGSTSSAGGGNGSTGAAVSNGTGGTGAGVVGSGVGAASTGANPNTGGGGAVNSSNSAGGGNGSTGAAVSNGTGGTGAGVVGSGIGAAATGASPNTGGGNAGTPGTTTKGPPITGENQGGGGQNGGGSANPSTGN